MALTLTARRERKKMRKIAVKRRMAEKEKKGKKGKERRAEQGFRRDGKIKEKEEEEREGKAQKTAAKDATDACVNSSTPSLYARGQYQEDTAAL